MSKEAERTEDIVGNLIKKAAEEMSQESWPGLWETKPMEGQLKLASDRLEINQKETGSIQEEKE